MEISQKSFPAKNLLKQTTYLLLEAKPFLFQLRACNTIGVTVHMQLNKFLTVHIKPFSKER